MPPALYGMLSVYATFFVLGTHAITIEELPPDHVRELSCGRMYYRTFHLDENRDTLYVGAMDHVYRLNLSNISHSSCKQDSINLEPSNIMSCTDNAKTT
ncbi:hypothetical protein ACI65C_009438, partial [Semiaphis heraclei]